MVSGAVSSPTTLMVQDAGCLSVSGVEAPGSVRAVPSGPPRVQDVGRCARSSAGLVSESPTTLSRCMMMA